MIDNPLEQQTLEIIDLWWDHNKDLYETKTPYIEIKK